MALNEKNIALLDYHFSGIKPEDAAKKAGYKGKNLRQQANKIIKKTEAQAYLAGRRANRIEQTNIDEKRWLQEEAYRPWSDIADVVDVDIKGNSRIQARRLSQPALLLQSCLLCV